MSEQAPSAETSHVSESAAAGSAGDSAFPGVLMAASIVGVVAAHGSLYQIADAAFETAREPVAWPGVIGLGDLFGGVGRGAAGSTTLWLSVLAVAAWFAGRSARQFGLRGALPAVVSVLVAVSPVFGGALRDGAGRAALLGCTALLVASGLPTRSPRLDPVTSLVIRGALLAFAVFASAGAFLPLAVAMLAFPPDVRTVTRRGVRIGIVVAGGLIPLLFPTLVPLGFGHTFDASWFAPPGGTAAGPTASFLGALAYSVGIGADLPFLQLMRFSDPWAIVWTGVICLAVLLLPTFGTRAQRWPLRVAGFAWLLGAFAVVLSQTSARPSALSGGLIAPAAVAIAIVVAAQAQRSMSSRLWSVLQWVPATALGVLSIAMSNALGASAPDLLVRAQQRDPSHPYAAFGSFHARFDRGDRDLQVLEDLLASAGDRPLTPATEAQLALRIATEFRAAGRSQEAVPFLSEWLGGTRDRLPLDVTAGPRARRVRLALEQDELMTALQWVDTERREFADDAVYLQRVAEAFLDHLRRQDPESPLPELLFEVIEDLVDRAVSVGGDAGGTARLVRAHLRVLQGKLVQGVRIAEEVSAEFPQLARPRLLLARIYLGLGEREAGLREVATARRIDPKDVAGRFLEGRLLAASPGRPDVGVRQMLAAFEEDRDLPGAARMLTDGVILAARSLRQSRGAAAADEIEELVRAVIANVPPSGLLTWELARLAKLRGEMEEAVALYDAALKLLPNLDDIRDEYAATLRDRGYASLLSDNRAGAVADFERAIALAPRGVDVQAMEAVVANNRQESEDTRLAVLAKEAFDRGVLHYSGGELDRAAEAFRESLESAPRNPAAYLNLGRIELERGDPAAAENELRRALEYAVKVQVDVESAYPLLLRALVDQNQLDPAMTLAQDYLRRYPEGRWREQMEDLVDVDSETAGDG